MNIRRSLKWTAATSLIGALVFAVVGCGDEGVQVSPPPDSSQSTKSAAPASVIQLDQNKQQQSTPATQPASTSSDKKEIVLTKEKYNQIQNGMNPDQVKAIMGGEGDVTESDINGTKLLMWMYTNHDYRNPEIITVSFINGAVNTKSESGL